MGVVVRAFGHKYGLARFLIAVEARAGELRRQLQD
jgi:hypothetical protein